MHILLSRPTTWRRATLNRIVRYAMHFALH
jgi:hypothetical protein